MLTRLTTESKNNNLIDPAFRNINRLLAPLFKNSDNDPMRDSFDKYYIPLVEIKHFYVLINSKPFLIKS